MKGRTGVGRDARAAPDEADAEGCAIVSHEACVVATTAPCQHCGANIEVICIHCFGGTVMQEPLTQFTVSDIREVDEALAGQLALWPFFRKAPDGGFANHCTHCGEPQAGSPAPRSWERSA